MELPARQVAISTHLLNLNIFFYVLTVTFHLMPSTSLSHIIIITPFTKHHCRREGGIKYAYWMALNMRLMKRGGNEQENAVRVRI